jgi:hypothetical protein
MNDLEVSGNWIESALWLGVSLTFLGMALRNSAPLRRLFLVLAGAFLLFGVSDVIETQTGAWWRPPWLLLLKGGCIVVFALCFRKYYRLTRRKDR